MVSRATCKCGNVYNPNSREWFSHDCPAKPRLEQFESVHMTADEWYAELLVDDSLYYRILDGIAKETASFKRRFGRLPEARENGLRDNRGNPQRTRDVA